MCGIAGIVHFDHSRRASAEVAANMAARLKHRGPDGEGALSLGPAAFGHRRLAIIDLATGAQPMTDAEGRYSIVFNGEIYNYRQLRHTLEALGYTHRTTSDTEIILSAWAEWGTDCFAKLNGMFAFAIWDKKTRTLTGARDPAGQKPFYWTVCDDTLLFASEPKAFLEYPAFRPVLDLRGLQDYLAYEYVPAPRTIFRGVYKLPAAHFFTWSPQHSRLKPDTPGALPVQPYWVIPKEQPYPGAANAKNRLRESLSASVERHLVSDVPVGIFLSGGMDSAAIAALACEHRSSIDTFTIGFTDRSFDESTYAEIVAKRLGTNHHLRTLEAEEAMQLVREIERLSDEPFGDASLVPTYLLSKFAREYLKVVLGGDGADETWAGYPTCHAHRHLRRYLRIPRILRDSVIKKAIEHLPVSHRNFSLDFKAKRFVRGANSPFPISHQIWMGSFTPADQAELLKRRPQWRFDDSLWNPVLERHSETTQPSLRSVLELDFHFYLANDILFKTDRAGMSTSLEIRAPFLDLELMDFVWMLPDQARMRGSRSKALLRDTVSDLIPSEILKRPKKGFGIPVAKWFRGPLKGTLTETLGILKDTGLFQEAALDRLQRNHEIKREDNRKQLWTLYALGRWFNAWNPEIP